jgi:acetyl esterase/lipase
VAGAFAWTCKNIGKYGGRKDHLFLCGHSAGGHLVSLLATDPQYLRAEGHSPSEIRGVCSISGVYRLAHTDSAFAAPFGKDAGVCKSASPLTHAAGKHPPFLIAYAENDLPQFDDMAEEMAAALKGAGSPVELVKCDRRNHITIVTRFASRADPLNEAFRDFVRKNCK